MEPISTRFSPKFMPESCKPIVQALTSGENVVHAAEEADRQAGRGSAIAFLEHFLELVLNPSEFKFILFEDHERKVVLKKIDGEIHFVESSCINQSLLRDGVEPEYISTTHLKISIHAFFTAIRSKFNENILLQRESKLHLIIGNNHELLELLEPTVEKNNQYLPVSCVVNSKRFYWKMQLSEKLDANRDPAFPLPSLKEAGYANSCSEAWEDFSKDGTLPECGQKRGKLFWDCFQILNAKFDDNAWDSQMAEEGSTSTFKREIRFCCIYILQRIKSLDLTLVSTFKNRDSPNFEPLCEFLSSYFEGDTISFRDAGESAVVQSEPNKNWMKSICNLVSKNPNVTSIFFSKCYIPGPLLANELKFNKTLRALNFENCTFQCNFYFSWLSELVEKNSALREIRIGKIDLYPKAYQDVLSALEKNFSLTLFESQYCGFNSWRNSFNTLLERNKVRHQQSVVPHYKLKLLSAFESVHGITPDVLQIISDFFCQLHSEYIEMPSAEEVAQSQFKFPNYRLTSSSPI